MMVAENNRSDLPMARANPSDTMPSLELHLSRSVFTAGRQLSGIVVFRLSRPTNIRALVVSVAGREVASGPLLRGAIHRPTWFFQREVLLSGREQPRFTSERISQYWNAFLGRDRCRALSTGEHTYPFSIPLPASLPPSFKGKAGTIDYIVAARVQFPMGRSVQVATEASVGLVRRAPSAVPVSLSSESGEVSSAEDVNVAMDIPSGGAELGKPLSLRFTITNPGQVPIERIMVSLEVNEEVRAGTRKELEGRCVDFRIVKPEDPNAALMDVSLELIVPRNASPTVESAAVSVVWFLKLHLSTTPSMEFKMPVMVYSLSP
ncbi:MAG: hypothetical protein M1133_02225 [Armatimonadetes bacterium]|nr:hypothetical protein [Armatimonadota bacterium]